MRRFIIWSIHRLYRQADDAKFGCSPCWEYSAKRVYHKTV